MSEFGNIIRIRQYFSVLLVFLILFMGISPVAAEPLSNNRHIFINVANDAGVKYDLDGPKYGGPSNTYYIKADGGGLNELHITNSTSDTYGQVSTTSEQSGVFYVTNTGGRGFDNDIILLIAVREPVRDDFSVTITSSGYNWTPAASGAYTPSPPTDYSYVASAVSEKFTKADLIYGSQNWKPGPGILGDLSLPIYNGQDMTDANDQFSLMFVDLKVGNMKPATFPGATLTDNGAVKIEYSFSQMDTFAAFNAYGWCTAANQDEGISWTNPTRDFIANGGATQSGQSGFAVNGVSVKSDSSGGSSGGYSSMNNGNRNGERGRFIPGTQLPDNPTLYGYLGKSMSTFKTGTVNGSLWFFFDPDNKPVLVSNRIPGYNLSVILPERSNITYTRMYLYLSDCQGIRSHTGIIPALSIHLDKPDGTILEPDQVYYDDDGDDNHLIAATYAFKVDEWITGNGTYNVYVQNKDYEESIFTIEGLLLVIASNNETAPTTSYQIVEGCDIVRSLPEKGLFSEDCDTKYSFPANINMSIATDANLYLVSTGIDEDNSTEHTVTFNDGTWKNILDNRDPSLITRIPVLTFLNDASNRADIESSVYTQNADYLVNRNAFLIVENAGTGESATNRNATTTESVPEDPINVTHTFSAGNGTSILTTTNPFCQIVLDTDPEGALIYLDETYLGKVTPATITVDTGSSHTVRFELGGYLPSEKAFTAFNSTTFRISLYSPTHAQKGRLAELPVDPDGILYGGLYVNSRPSGESILINGISTGKSTPFMFIGLKPGRYTVSLGKHAGVTAGEWFMYPDQTVNVLPETITPVDIDGIDYYTRTDIILDSHYLRGRSFTVNGDINNNTIPAKISTSMFDSFVTIYENESYVSYPIPIPVVVTKDDRYILVEPREFIPMNLSVTSDPPGAEVFIDGFRTGYLTPTSFTNVSDGIHRISVVKAGYIPGQRLVNLALRTPLVAVTNVDFDLEEYPSGFLYVDSVPQGGKISIDGMATGEITPALFKSLPTGTHLVRVTGENATKTFYDVTIDELKMTTLTANFTPKVNRG